MMRDSMVKKIVSRGRGPSMSVTSSKIMYRESNCDISAVMTEARFVFVSFPCQKVRATSVFATCANRTHLFRRFRKTLMRELIPSAVYQLNRGFDTERPRDRILDNPSASSAVPTGPQGPRTHVKRLLYSVNLHTSLMATPNNMILIDRSSRGFDTVYHRGSYKGSAGVQTA